VQLTRQWLEQVVVGLGLCPFAAQPLNEGRVRIQHCQARDELALLHSLHEELHRLDQTPASQLETTLLVIPHLLADFRGFNAFLDKVDALLTEFSWQGIYQVASFHPQYCFAGTAPGDAGNLTNRAPFPLLHLIREDSLTTVLADVQHPEEIPQRNIQRMNTLNESQLRKLFPWLFNKA